MANTYKCSPQEAKNYILRQKLNKDVLTIVKDDSIEIIPKLYKKDCQKIINDFEDNKYNLLKIYNPDTKSNIIHYSTVNRLYYNNKTSFELAEQISNKFQEIIDKLKCEDGTFAETLQDLANEK